MSNYNYQFSYLTEKGRRNTNQDNVAVFHNKKKTAFLIVVADGMGGYNGGEIASKIVIDTAKEIFFKAGKSLIKKKNKLKSVIQLIFDSSQNKIREQVAKNPELTGMGTTMVCVLIVENIAVWGNIGDSRIYLKLDDNDPQLITKDHSLVQDYIDKHDGEISVQYLNQYSNVITKSLAGNDDQIDIFPLESDFLELSDKFIFLLCSDGLILDKSYDYSYFFFKNIESYEAIEHSTRNLFHWAYNSGSTDNITIALISGNKTSKKSSKKILLTLFTLIISTILGFIGYLYYNTIYKPHIKHKPNQITKDIRKKTINKKKDTLPVLGNKGKAENINWTGFNSSHTIEFSDRNSNISFGWVDYKKNNIKSYLLSFSKYNNNEPISVSKEISADKNHVTIKDIGEDIKKLEPGTYRVKLYVLTEKGDSILSPNSIQLTIKK